MLKIFHASGSRSLRVIWMAEEMELDYELSLEAIGRSSPEFIAVNPARGPHLAGEAFTAADISVVYALNMGGALGLADDYPAPIADYWARVKTRPAYQAAIAK